MRKFLIRWWLVPGWQQEQRQRAIKDWYRSQSRGNGLEPSSQADAGISVRYVRTSVFRDPIDSQLR